MKLFSPRVLIIIASIFLFWTLLFNVSHNIYENYDIKLTKIADETAPLIKANGTLVEQVNNLQTSDSNYSSTFNDLSKKSLNILEKMINNQKNARQLTEQRISSISFLYFIFPEYKVKDKLYLESLNWTIKSIQTSISLANQGIANGGFETAEGRRLFQVATANNGMQENATTAFNEFYWNYNMHKTLIYQWMKGTIICIASSLISLAFIVLSVIQIFKLILAKQKTVLLPLLIIAVIIFLYAFMFFGPLMLLPKIPYISW